MNPGPEKEQVPDSWEQQYEAEFSSYEACAVKLELLIEDLLIDAGIDVVDIEARAKSPDSFVRKVAAKKGKYDTPLKEVTDLIGVRVIAYYLEDVERISQIIASEFLVDEKNSIDKLDNLEPDRFGYRSVHHVVALSAPRSELVEWANFDGKKAEIQVRTATQHAWAAVEHKLNYKKTREAPRDLRRRLIRLSALFELADEQFSSVKDQLEDVEAKYSIDVKGGNLNLPVDTASVEAFLDGNNSVGEIVKLAEAAGFQAAASDSDGYRNRFEGDLRDMVLLLDQLGISTLADLSAIFEDKQGMDDAIMRLGSHADEVAWGSPIDFLTVLVCFQQEASTEVFGLIYNDLVTGIVKEAREETL